MRAELQTSPPLTPSTTQHIASIYIEQLTCSVVSCRSLTLSSFPPHLTYSHPHRTCH